MKYNLERVIWRSFVSKQKSHLINLKLIFRCYSVYSSFLINICSPFLCMTECLQVQLQSSLNLPTQLDNLILYIFLGLFDFKFITIRCHFLSVEKVFRQQMFLVQALIKLRSPKKCWWTRVIQTIHFFRNTLRSAVVRLQKAAKNRKCVDFFLLCFTADIS